MRKNVTPHPRSQGLSPIFSGARVGVRSPLLLSSPNLPGAYTYQDLKGMRLADLSLPAAFPPEERGRGWRQCSRVEGTWDLGFLTLTLKLIC